MNSRMRHTRYVINIPGADGSKDPIWAWFDERAHIKSPHVETYDATGNHRGIVCPHTGRFTPNCKAQEAKNFKVR